MRQWYDVSSDRGMLPIFRCLEPLGLAPKKLVTVADWRLSSLTHGSGYWIRTDSSRYYAGRLQRSGTVVSHQ